MTSHTRLDGPKADKELIAGFEAGSGNGQGQCERALLPPAARLAARAWASHAARR